MVRRYSTLWRFFCRGYSGVEGPSTCDGGGLDLQGLLGLGGEDHRAGDNQGRAHVLLGDLLVIFQGALLKNHLDAFEAAAVR